MKQPRVLLADDHQAVRDGVRDLLEPEFEVVGTVKDGQSLLPAADTLKPDIIVVDISMPVLTGIEAVKQLKKSKPNARVVFLTVHAESAIVSEALDTGALGYVLKSRAPSDLIPAIREALADRTYLSPSLRDPGNY